MEPAKDERGGGRVQSSKQQRADDNGEQSRWQRRPYPIHNPGLEPDYDATKGGAGNCSPRRPFEPGTVPVRR